MMSTKDGKGIDWLLSEGAWSKQFSDEVEAFTINIDPGGVESDNGIMIEGAEEVNLGVKPL